MAANVMQFCDINFVTGAVTPRLVLDYIEGGTSIPAPSHEKIWAFNSTTDGALYVNGKYELIPITLALKVAGTSKTDLDSDIRAIITEITRENWLEVHYDGATTGVYYHTYPYDTAEAQSIMSRCHRDAFVAHPLTITLMADPFAVGPEESITVVDNLLINGGFEDFTGDDPDDWTVTETAGAGAAVVTHEDTDIVFGSHSLDLSTTAADSVAKVQTTAAITGIDPDKHYNIVFNYMCGVGTLDKLTCNIIQYDADHNGSTITITPTVTATDVWYLSTTVIHPHDSGEAILWDADVAEVKIDFTLTGAGDNPTQYYVDGAVFTCSEYLSGNELSNALGIVLPPDLITGDVPAPVDIYLTKFEDNLETAATYVGGREQYSASYNPSIETTTGTDDYSAASNKGTRKYISIPDNLVLNPGFETHDSATPTADFDNWAESMGGAHLTYTANKHSGSYAAFSDHTGSSTTTNTLTSDAMVIDPTKDYQFAMWFQNYNWSGASRITVTLYAYDDAGATHAADTPSFTILNSVLVHRSYTQKAYTINANGGGSPEWSADTIRAKIVISHSGKGTGSGFDTMRVDDVSLLQTSSDIKFNGKNYVDCIGGAVKPFLHYRLDSAKSSKVLTLLGNLETGGVDITDLDEIQLKTVNLLATYRFEGDGLFDPINLPTHRYSDNAVTSALYQELQVRFDTSIGAGTTVYIDNLSLIPVDNGYTALGADDNQYLIFDSQSDFPCVLVSTDGAIDKAVYLSSMRQRFTVDPQNGSNFAVLHIWQNSSGHQYGQFLAEITMKYRPRYLLVT